MFQEFFRRTKKNCMEKVGRFFTDFRIEKMIRLGEKTKQMKDLLLSFGPDFSGDHSGALDTIICYIRVV